MKKIIYSLVIIFTAFFVKNVNAETLVQGYDLYTHLKSSNPECTWSSWCYSSVNPGSGGLLYANTVYYDFTGVKIPNGKSADVARFTYLAGYYSAPGEFNTNYDNITARVFYGSSNADCKVSGSGFMTIDCPVLNDNNYEITRLQVRIMGAQTWRLGLSGAFYFVKSDTSNITGAIESQTSQMDKNQAQTNERLDEANKGISETKDFITSDEEANSDISVLGNVQGIFPPGPVDSLLNIPFEFLSILSSSFSGTCKPVSISFVYDMNFTIPCFSEVFYSNVPDFLMLFIDLVPSAFILITYFKHLYKKVDRAVNLETNSDDEWGVL